MGWHVMLHAFLLSVGTGMLCGVAPALAASRPVVPNSLKGESTLQRPGRRLSLRNILVATQMAMSLMLLVGASLLVQSMLRLERQNLGIRQDHLLKGHIYIPEIRYPNPGAITRFCDQFADRVPAEVQNAGSTSQIFLGVIAMDS